MTGNDMLKVGAAALALLIAGYGLDASRLCAGAGRGG